MAAGAACATADEGAATARARGGTSASIAKELESDNALDFRFDEDVSISRTGNTTKAQIDAIDAAEREFEESAKQLGVRAAARTTRRPTAAPAKRRRAGAVVERPRVPPRSQHRRACSTRPPPSSTKDEPVSPALARPQAAIDLDKLDLSFGPEHATFEDPTPSVLDGQWHDAATKLDLAKAYQEMGDVEGAREILQEVLHEGDDTQKAEAQVLLAKLG